MVKKLERQKDLQSIQHRKLPGTPELGQRIVKVFRGFRDLIDRRGGVRVRD
jgi:hypothetical protein